MPDSRTYHVISDDNCKFESMTKEQILAAIQQAIGTGTVTDVDAGFITKIKELNRNGYLKFWIGTTAQYNAIQTKETNMLYILTDDTEFEDMETEINNFRSELDDLTDMYTTLSGTVSGHSTDITALQTASETYGDKFFWMEAKKDWVLSNSVIQYGDTYEPLQMPYHIEEHPMHISDWDVVKVKAAGQEVLCSVYEFTTGYTWIKGSVSYIAQVTGSGATDTLVTIVVSLKCDEDNFLIQNNSKSFYLGDNGNITVAQQNITKIVGLM